MRLVGILVGGLLFASVLTEGALLVASRRRIAALETKVAELGRAPAAESPDARDEPEPEEPPARTRGGRVPPPRFVEAAQGWAAAAAGDDPLPLPASIDGPEAREQLRRFVVAQVERQRQEDRERFRERRERMETRLRDQLSAELGLRPDERTKLDEAMGRAADARVAILNRLESGEITRLDLRREMNALREKTDGEVKALLGDERFARYRELREAGFRTALEASTAGPGASVGGSGGPFYR